MATGCLGRASAGVAWAGFSAKGGVVPHGNAAPGRKCQPSARGSCRG